MALLVDLLLLLALVAAGVGLIMWRDRFDAPCVADGFRLFMVVFVGGCFIAFGVIVMLLLAFT